MVVTYFDFCDEINEIEKLLAIDDQINFDDITFELDQLLGDKFLKGKKIYHLAQKYFKRLKSIFYLFDTKEINQFNLEVFLSEIISAFEGFIHETLKEFIISEIIFNKIKKKTLNSPSVALEYINSYLGLKIELPTESSIDFGILIDARNAHIHRNSLGNEKILSQLNDDIFLLPITYMNIVNIIHDSLSPL